jgi:hypothetical protein
MQPKQNERWNKKIDEIGEIRDGLGKKVDGAIVETVAIFRLFGFTTTGSCGGHVKRITGGPYVIFESPEAARLAREARALGKKVNEVSQEYNTLRDEAVKHSVREVQKLIPYLNDFYHGRETPYENRLIIRTFPLTYTCLKCQGAELAKVLDAKKSKELLLRNRAEMHDFTEYLKRAYFERNKNEEMLLMPSI